jgi:hypothetical protein
MTHQEKIELIKRIKGYLEPQSFTTLELLTPSERLRRQADELDKQREDLFLFNEYIEELENN